ncbi:type II toxin-antitoxin system HicB family antitoxin, partial [Tepidanaerobacter sp. EBM-49]
MDLKKVNFTILIEKDEDGLYIASVPALRGCHTQAKTVE